jgi:hypothetical protein
MGILFFLFFGNKLRELKIKYTARPVTAKPEPHPTPNYTKESTPPGSKLNRDHWMRFSVLL